MPLLVFGFSMPGAGAEYATSVRSGDSTGPEARSWATTRRAFVPSASIVQISPGPERVVMNTTGSGVSAGATGSVAGGDDCPRPGRAMGLLRAFAARAEARP